MENMKKYYSGDVYGKNMWPAARAYSAHKFKYFFDKVLQASPDVQNWLKAHHPSSVNISTIIWLNAGMHGSKSTKICLSIAWQMQ